jgi:hypothetical protein
MASRSQLRKTVGYAALAALLFSAFFLWPRIDFVGDALQARLTAFSQRRKLAAYVASKQAQDALRLTVQEQRILLHLPKRGFPWLVALTNEGYFYTWADSILFKKDHGAMETRVMGNERAYFLLLRQLAPSPAAMRFEQEAKELQRMMFAHAPLNPKRSEFLSNVERVHAFFDQLKGLPQMTPAEFARERAESAVLAPEEYLDYSNEAVPPDRRKWPDRQMDRQMHWEHERFLFAYSECSGRDDYERIQMVVKPQGGVFEACQTYSGSHFRPDSYESKLSPAEADALKNYLSQMPLSDAGDQEVHFIVSFVAGGSWVTRTYQSLPPGEPFRPLLKRMIRQSAVEWTEDLFERSEFLKPE